MTNVKGEDFQKHNWRREQVFTLVYSFNSNKESGVVESLRINLTFSREYDLSLLREEE
jgi:hypothetical protein